MQIKEQQQRDSVRMVWNAMANSKNIMAKAGVPQAFHYTLLPSHQPSLLLKSPLRCPHCHSYMNPYNRIHIGNQAYTCCICKADNPLPVDYIQRKDKMPEEMTLGFSSFVMGRAQAVQAHEMGYLFVVDVAIDKKELLQVKRNLEQLIEGLSEEKVVGLITYHKYVDLHDLGSQVETTIRFSAGHAFDLIEFNNFLSIENNQHNAIHNKYLVKLKDCRTSLKRRIAALQSVKHPNYKHQREARATGQALNVAITLTNVSIVPTRVVLLIGGVCTVGLGKVIDQDYKVQMRSINEGLPPQSKQAVEFYNQLGEKAQQKSIAIDAFVFGVEEAGLTEMLGCLRRNGGLLVQHQQFASHVFAQSFRKAYRSQQSETSLTLGTQVILEIKNSPEIVVTAVQDSKKQMKKLNRNLSRLGNITETTTITVQFEAAQNNTDVEAYYIQIKTIFKDATDLGTRLQRVTTLRRLFVSTAVDMINGFDQEAAIVLLAKLAIQRSLEESREHTRLWLDNALISWGIMFAYYKLGDPQTFKLSESAKYFPQYVYYLRRSPLIRRSKISLDEYTYIAQIVKSETTRNTLLAIQPALLQYSTQQTDAHPVSLDQKYMRPESILLLDSFFNLVEWRGKNVHAWVESNLHQTQQFAYLEQMLNNVAKDTECLRNSRFPVPFCYKTSAGHSKERFLKSRLGTREQQQIQNSNLSDQADVNSFTSRFIQLVVGK